MTNTKRVQSAAEAHHLHEEWRAWLLALARHHAVTYALLRGTVHTRIVRGLLCDEGILPAQGTGTGAAVERWLGSVFKKGPWTQTGEEHAVTSSATNIHGGQTVRVWRLTTTDTEALAPWLVRPEEPEGARDKVLACYAPPVRAVPEAPRGLVLALPEGLDLRRVADELRNLTAHATLRGEKAPVGFAELEAALRGLASDVANDGGAR